MNGESGVGETQRVASEESSCPAKVLRTLHLEGTQLLESSQETLVKSLEFLSIQSIFLPSLSSLALLLLLFSSQPGETL